MASVMPIMDLLADSGADIYYDEDFLSVVEDHMTYLRSLSSTYEIVIKPGDAYKYEFDLFGLLALYGIKRSLHRIVMRLNDFLSPLENTVELQSLLIPSETVINQIRQTHQTVHKLS